MPFPDQKANGKVQIRITSIYQYMTAGIWNGEKMRKADQETISSSPFLCTKPNSWRGCLSRENTAITKTDTIHLQPWWTDASPAPHKNIMRSDTLVPRQCQNSENSASTGAATGLSQPRLYRHGVYVTVFFTYSTLPSLLSCHQLSSITCHISPQSCLPNHSTI